jgi:hypothetical protein
MVLFLASPALAQENMPHPKTGEPGAWIPRILQLDHLKLETELNKTGEPGAWIPRILQLDHLKLETELKSCKKLQEKREEQLEKKDEEIEERKSALEEEKEASRALTQVLTGSELELAEEKKQNSRLTGWLWGTSTAAVVATTILVLVVAL